MAKQTINIGTNPNDNTGDPLRTAFNKVNANFTEVYELVNAISVGDIISAVNRASAISANLTSVDNKLSGAVDVVSAAVVSVNNRISTVSSQVANIGSAASALSVNLASVDGRLTSVENRLSNAISALSAELTSVKNAISNTVSITSADLTSTKNNLQSAINVVSNALSNEISNRNSAINVVSNALSALSVRADTMSNRISDEISNRRSASADLESHINTVSNAVSVVSAAVASVDTKLSNAISVLSANFTSTNAQLSNAWSAINRLSNVVSGLGGTNLDVISQSLSVISAAFVSQADRVSAISAQMFSINTVVSNLASNLTSIDNKLSNAVSVISQQVSVLSARVNTNSAQMTSANDAISNAVSIVSAAQLSTWNRVSAVLTSSTSFTGVKYTFGPSSTLGNIVANGDVLFNRGNLNLVSAPGNTTYYDINGSGTVTAADALVYTGFINGTADIRPYKWLGGHWAIAGTQDTSGIFGVAGNANDALLAAVGGSQQAGDTLFFGAINSSGYFKSGIIQSGGQIRLKGNGSVSNGGIFFDGDAIQGGSLIPNANVTYNLGNSTSYYNTVYAQNFTGNLSLGSGTVTGNLIPSANITYTLGNTSTRWLAVYATTFSGTASTAQYADLAEKYLADAEYDIGTVVVIGGAAEVTQSVSDHNNSVLGVVSGKPAYLMNSESAGASIALTGRVPCLVKGPVQKGDVLVTSDIPGRAQTLNSAKFMPGCILGKALESTDKELDTIEIVVGIH
jgi:chromosome segregation ATPase